MVGSLDGYLRGYSDGCQVSLAGDVVAIVAESFSRDFYMGFLLNVEDLDQEIFEAV